MNKEHIQQLINRYLAGETTPAEEAALAAALSGSHAENDLPESFPEEWKVVREMLAELSDGATEYDRIMAERKAANERTANERKAAKKRLAIARRWMSAAAAVAVLLAFWWQWNRTPAAEPQGTEARGGVGTNPGRDSRFVAPGLNPGNKNGADKSSPSGETYMIAKNDFADNVKNNVKEASPKGEDKRGPEKPGLKPCATNRTSLRDRGTSVGAGQPPSSSPVSRGTEMSAHPTEDYAAQQLRADTRPAPTEGGNHNVYIHSASCAHVVYVMRLADQTEEVMNECERAILEEEFQQQEQRARTVFL